jgi:hypothetical protein
MDGHRSLSHEIGGFRYFRPNAELALLEYGNGQPVAAK